ncbi:MAG: hypothetical protein Q8O00_09790 [Holophaga sp.]|nr:hypothetical protein [Holophaga sp.]
MRKLLPFLFISASLVGSGTAAWLCQDKGSPSMPPQPWSGDPSDAQIRDAFGKQGIRINGAEVAGLRANVLLALQEARAHGIGNSKVDFAAVEIAHDLGLDSGAGSSTVRNIVSAIGYLVNQRGHVPPRPTPPPPPPMEWRTYFNETTNLWHQSDFMQLMARNQFHPVKISWEDIGRHQGSAWGDRISDVGIWVREHESDPSSAKLALSVRRDGNFRDKVLMVPADKIKVHVKSSWGGTVEKTLPQRLQELGLSSPTRDRNVIVSNQFAIVPVPSRSMRGASPEGVPPRAAFTFSIFPYGSTNFVITDVIEGSSDAIVGSGNHQLLMANVNGQKAPFTASRAEDRPDLLRLERDLKARGMDVDVQRYYLIQIPLRRDRRIQASNLGTPPMARAYGGVVMNDMEAMPSSPMVYSKGANAAKAEEKSLQRSDATSGLGKVAIGHGEVEGSYFTGSGYQGARADEPIRVTVVYFVTPVGKVTARDMETFTKAFTQWDSQAIWGGSFVTKE